MAFQRLAKPVRIAHFLLQSRGGQVEGSIVITVAERGHKLVPSINSGLGQTEHSADYRTKEYSAPNNQHQQYAPDNQQDTAGIAPSRARLLGRLWRLLSVGLLRLRGVLLLVLWLVLLRLRLLAILCRSLGRWVLLRLHLLRGL
jgi:hypothetical protein